MVTEAPVCITSAGSLEEAVRILACHPVVAMDLEADSMHHFEEKVCLLQLATDTSCFIVDPLRVTDLSPLESVFSDPGIVKVLHGADYDIRSLYRDFGITMQNLFDTEIACRFLGYSHSSLEAVLKRHFSIELDKKYQKKDWSVRPLPAEMIAYAADDVCFLVDLYHRLKAKLSEKKRLSWVMETCAALCRVRAGAPGDHPLFTSIKGAGKLDPRSLAVLENLAVFRRETARKKDRPPYKILGNRHLLELAREKPDTAGRLHRSGILSKKQCHMYGESITAAIRDAMDRDEKTLPRYPKNKTDPPSAAVTRRVNALKKWRGNKAAELEIDPAVLINNAAIHTIAATRPETVDRLEDVGILKNWQIREFGRQWIEIIEKTG